MDDMIGLRFLSTLVGGGIDWTVLIAFLVFSLVAFLSPVVGYESKRPLGISVSLFLLIAYMLIALFQYIIMWMWFYDQSGGNNLRPGRSGGPDSSPSAYFGFSVVKLVVFVAAMMTFTAGVLSLRIRKPKPFAVEVEKK
jgi:hypothetical protein